MPRPVRKPAARSTSLSPASVPPIIAGLVCLADPEYGGIPAEFVKVWAEMPALVRRTLEGHSDDRWSIIRDVSGVTEAEKQAEKGTNPTTRPPTERDIANMTRGIALLYHDHVDNITDVITPVASIAFYVGIAYASYILTNGGDR